jgi:FkbM family methyltransferase
VFSGWEMLRYIEKKIDKWRFSQYAKGAPIRTFPASELSGYFSQYGQDKLVSEFFFPDKRGGVFADIGAHDGKSLSNTFYLEKHLGWTGLAVEPNPVVFKALSQERSCITVNACIGHPEGLTRFRVVSGSASMLSEAADVTCSRSLARTRKLVTNSGESFTEIEVMRQSLTSLCKKHNISHIDYLSIDVEGAEMQVLESLDFGLVDVSVIGIENNFMKSDIPKLLQSRGFEFACRLGVDEFYAPPHLLSNT